MTIASTPAGAMRRRGLDEACNASPNEVTSSSDLDWILLIDGQSMPEHKNQEREIQKALVADGLTEPGSSGVFGRMVGSHDLVHNIGGEEDLNSNTTRRVLLLLESLPVGNREAFDRVRRQVLRRYLEDDRGLLYGSGDVRIPRFLLNDFTRYWTGSVVRLGTLRPESEIDPATGQPVNDDTTPNDSIALLIAALAVDLTVIFVVEEK